MDALIQEIAKTFNIGNETVQNLIDSYPQLRQQVAYYNVTTTVQAIMFVLGVISFLAFLDIVNASNNLELVKKWETIMESFEYYEPTENLYFIVG